MYSPTARLESPPRFHGLDGVRAFAMLLGVFLHASMPYIEAGLPWAVIDSSRSISLTLLIYGIHSFRMPTFFLIAGFFARLVFHQKGLGFFVRHRGQRILLPLVVGWVVLHPIVRTLWVWSGVRAMANDDGSALRVALSTAAKPVPYGLGLMHLWFLYYLLVLYFAFFFARWVFTRFVDVHGERRKELDVYFEGLMGSRWAASALAVPTTWVLMMMPGWGAGFVPRTLVVSPPHELFYGSFFVVGWMLHRNPDLITILRNRCLSYCVTAAVTLFPLTAMLYLINVVKANAGPWFRLGYFLLYGTLIWSSVFGMVGLFQRFFDRPNKWLRYLADSSYWLYLAHFPLVIIASILLREWHVGWFIKLPVVLASCVPVLLASYHLLVRSTWIGVVLNGRRLPFRSIRATADGAA